ncbi:TetR/AcrR family transcriptional regulator [Mobilicoccus sp.]|uniref:TetR/AcrR family transcriptional regulator n=1 Tax=Mobilicoccus sp. TaxID=2034349 RepID=UPI0028ACFA87|nr:TetR/AcrR family transcriptional regulator [Mobilicoccus sp.]
MAAFGGTGTAPARESSSQTNRAVSTRRQATRERLLDATRDVVGTKGYHGASVEEICEAAGFTRGAFYSNYADKDEIVLALVEREQERVFRAMHEESGIHGADSLEATIDALLAAQEPDRGLFLLQAEIMLLALRTPDFTRVAATAERMFRSRIADILAIGLHHLRLEPIIDLDAMAECISAITSRSIQHAMLAGEDDLLALARLTLPHIVRSLTRATQATPTDASNPSA